MSSLRILLADDHEIVRKIIEAQAGWEIAAELSNGRDAVQKVKSQNLISL
jgi:CheY-like chemotaxis protein